MDSKSPDNHPSPSSHLPPENGGGKQLFQLTRPMKIGIAVVLIALASVGVLTSSFLQNDDSSKTSSEGLDSSEIQERKPVTPFELTDADGKKTAFDQFKGKVVMLTFWTTECATCLVDLPTFAQIQEKFGDDFVVVPVNEDEGDLGKQFSRDFWSKNNFAFTSYFDEGKSIAKQFDVQTIPASFVIDRQGRIVLSGFGVTDWNDPETVGIVEGLLNEK